LFLLKKNLPVSPTHCEFSLEKNLPVSPTHCVF
jgi:hypothetical protein